MDTKRCYKCKIFKPKAGFQKDATKKDGLHGKCKECVKRYLRSDKAKELRKITSKRANKKKRLKFPKRIKARQILNYAVESGKIPRPDSLKCDCGQKAVEYHHGEGYEKENWLNVIAICVPCHKRLHTA